MTVDVVAANTQYPPPVRSFSQLARCLYDAKKCPTTNQAEEQLMVVKGKRKKKHNQHYVQLVFKKYLLHFNDQL